MKGKIFIDHDNVINWSAENTTGDIEGTVAAMQLLGQLVDEHAPIAILVDLTQAERPNVEQRDIIIAAVNERAKKITHIALYGHTGLMTVVAQLIMHKAQYPSMRFFSNREQAIQWINSVKA